MTVSISIMFYGGRVAVYDKVLNFTFRKEIYLPYTSLDAAFVGEDDDISNAVEISLYIGGKLVHHGLVDTVSTEISSGGTIIRLSSRSFTSLLVQNQTEPGLKTRVSINSLMNSFYTFPYITHEDRPETGYIYVKPNSSMWDSVVNLSYKLFGTYPYIRGTNCIMVSSYPQPESFSYTSGDILAAGRGVDLRSVKSNFHMANLSGEYDEFEYEDTFAVQHELIRHHFFELDNRFLYSPEDAPEYQAKLCSRGRVRHYCRYSGYNGEDLFDEVTFPGVNGKKAAEVKISGSGNGVVTEVSTYEDMFMQ